VLKNWRVWKQSLKFKLALFGLVGHGTVYCGIWIATLPFDLYIGRTVIGTNITNCTVL